MMAMPTGTHCSTKSTVARYQPIPKARMRLRRASHAASATVASRKSGATAYGQVASAPGRG